MKLKNISYGMQIFTASLLLVIIPTIILGIFTANRTAQQVNSQHDEALKTVTNQINLNLDTVLSDAEKIGNLYIINDDIRKAMITDYDGRMFDFARDSTMMLTQVSQANRLNANVTASLFLNRYGYTFEYNILSVRSQEQMLERIGEWKPLALENNNNLYFGPVQTNTLGRRTLPMIKVLWDVYTNVEIGVFYMDINFDAIANILESSRLSNSQVVFFDQDNQLYFATEESALGAIGGDPLLAALQEISRSVDRSAPEREVQLDVGGSRYHVHAVYNQTTSWSILHFMDDSIVTNAYRQNIQGYAAVFAVSILCGLLLAFVLSYGLSNSIRLLTRAIDSCEGGDISTIDIQSSLNNKELRKVTDSYNRLNRRLNDSLEQNYVMHLNNYAAQLSEKQMQLKMLQAQINPHFLYNTLNLIGSLANIHGISEIKTIAGSISDIFRYNLKEGPIVRLEDEIKQVVQYMTIYQIRFPEKFRFSCEAPPELMDIEVPIFILQPIIENAVGHGLEEKVGNAVVSVFVYAESPDFHILITDNGKGIAPARLKAMAAVLQGGTNPRAEGEEGAIGIINVHRRILAYYGEGYGISIESAVGEGTTVDIRLPLYQKPEFTPPRKE